MHQIALINPKYCSVSLERNNIIQNKQLESIDIFRLTHFIVPQVRHVGDINFKMIHSRDFGKKSGERQIGLPT